MPLTQTENPPETNCNPALARVAWGVATTKPNQERELIRRLHRDVPYVCPYSTHKDNRNRTIYTPLFSCYVFVGELRIKQPPSRTQTPNAFFAAKQTTKTTGWLNVPDQLQLREALGLLVMGTPEQRKAQTHKALTLEELQTGLKVQTNTGLTGYVQGVTLQKKGRTRVFINVEMLGQTVSVETDVENLHLPNP